MRTISEIIEVIKEKKGLSKDADVANLLNINPKTFATAKSRNSIPFEELTSLCNKEGWSLNFLLTGEGTPESSIQYKPVAIGDEQSPDNKDFVSVPRVSGAIGAGSGRVPNNNIEVSIAFRKDWIERKGDPRNMSLIKVSGDSMAPTFVSGDLILVDHNKNYIDPQGGLYAIVLDDGIMIKRIQVMYPGKKLKIASDNLNYESIEVEADLVTVNGKVIWFGREIDR